jgi:type III secretion protein C
MSAPVASQTGREEPATFPIIQAEPRLNAVVIRDYRTRMSRYAELIAELDQPTSLVEISAQIIDVDHEASLDLGIHWSYSQAGGTRFGLGQSAMALGEPQLHYSAMLANQTRQFLFRVRAMEVEGRARVTSRPSVLTANNQEALIEHTQTAHVKVGGTWQASLFEVVAGTVLRVTPKVVSHGGRRAVEMSMNVEDGNFSDARQVDSIPVVNRSALRTQATVLENQSILIGGLSFRQEGARSEGVPYLRKIPLLGLAFSAKTRLGKSMERMVLISPRVTQWERPSAAPPRRPETPPMPGKPLFRGGL